MPLKVGIKIPFAPGDRLVDPGKGKYAFSKWWTNPSGSDIDDVLHVEAVGPDFVVAREGHYGFPVIIVFDAHGDEPEEVTQRHLNRLAARWKQATSSRR